MVGLRNTVEDAMVLETGCPVDVADIEEDEMVRISENGKKKLNKIKIFGSISLLTQKPAGLNWLMTADCLTLEFIFLTMVLIAPWK